MGDARDWAKWSHLIRGDIDYYKSGMPCTNYSSLGDRKGSGGDKGGDLYLEQLLFIAHHRPKCCRLEMTPTALDTNDGMEVKFIHDKLAELDYVVYSDIIDCFRYGDPTSRRRLMIIAIRSDIDAKSRWTWPAETFSSEFYPTSRDIAELDDKVPKHYWLHDAVRVKPTSDCAPRAAKLQSIGTTASIYFRR